MEVNFDFSSKKTIAGVVALICIIALIIYLPNILSLGEPDVCIIDGVCQHEQYVEFMTLMVPVFVIVGIVIGALVFFFMSGKLENSRKDLEKTVDALLQFLNKDEKAIVQKILDNKGKIFQSEISRIEGIGKLKSHRILQRLSDRGVIEIEKHGKTNIVRLAKNIGEAVLH